MKAVVRVLLACSLSVSIAVGLSLVQQSGDGEAGGGVPVFSHKPKALTNDTVVDRLAPLPLYLSIAKVEWREPVLAVDLWVKPVDADRNHVYEDLLQLARLGFGSTSNVDQLLVRVMEKNGDGTEKKLLLTMDARREQFPLGEQKNGQRSTLEAQALLQTNAALTYTAWWKQRFGS